MRTAGRLDWSRWSQLKQLGYPFSSLFIQYAVFGYVIMGYLLREADGKLGPGDLTWWRDMMRSNIIFAAFCVSTSLHQVLKFQS